MPRTPDKVNMQILGLDFTSAPRKSKPITVAHGTLTGNRLAITSLARVPDFDGVRVLLSSRGPWIAGLDFPFGVPRKFLEAVGWSGEWAEQAERVSRMTKGEFESVLLAFKAGQPVGQKEPLRRTDRTTKAKSPLKLNNPPVGKMYFEGVRLLLDSEASVLPCRPSESERIICESYPAVPARLLIGQATYKNDTKKKQTVSQLEARQSILRGISTPQFEHSYHISVSIDPVVVGAAISDPTGDSLDAILACIQVASASLDSAGRFYIPKDVDPCEGWIADAVIFDQLDETEYHLSTASRPQR